MTQRILVVDDDREIVRLLRASLEQAGYQVFVAYDGRTLADSSTPIAYLNYLPGDHLPHAADSYRIPDRRGRAVCRRIRELSDVLIMMLSAQAPRLLCYRMSCLRINFQLTGILEGPLNKVHLPVVSVSGI